MLENTFYNSPTVIAFQEFQIENPLVFFSHHQEQSSSGVRLKQAQVCMQRVRNSERMLMRVETSVDSGNNLEFSQNSRSRTVIWGIYTTPGQTLNRHYIPPQRYLHIYVHCCSIQGSYEREMSINRWIDNKNVVHICSRILLSCKKK